jgi:hypothetical protein
LPWAIAPSAASIRALGMLIRRCAWHREFHGYTMIHGVASWRGVSVRFTDGVCRQCAARVRVEWHVVQSGVESKVPQRSLFLGRYRRVALVTVFAVLVIMVFPAKRIMDAMLKKAPAVVESAMAIGEPPDVSVAVPARTPMARANPEAGLPPVRQRRASVSKPVVVRYSPPKPLGPVWSPEEDPVAVPPPTVVRPVEPQRHEPVRHAASVSPAVGHISRARATEDELMRVARGQSTSRLLLFPPEERPRHAGLAIQTP